jgi:Fic family protein
MIVKVTSEPLQDFSGLASQLRPQLCELGVVLEEFTARNRAGGILPNLVEAIRIELTYNSNAIEGSTLTLRQTQLAIEGTVPQGTPSMRELYEARNHDLALREIESWAAEKRGPPTEADLLRIHQRIMTDVASYAGQFRSDRVLISGSGFVPPASSKF